MSRGQDKRALNTLFNTNNYSIISKYSAIKLGYVQNQELVEFIEEQFQVRKGWRRTPLVNLGYANRLLAVDHEVGKLLHGQGSPGVDCFIVVGCGFDMLAVRHEKDCHWIEVDLPQVIHTKADYFARKWQQPRLLIDSDQDMITFEGKNLYLVSCDIRFQETFSTKLSRVLSTFSQLSSVAILNEVCFCYLGTHQVKQAISTMVDCVKDRAVSLSYLGFEQIRPEVSSPFTKIMLTHLDSFGFPLKHFQTGRELHELFVDQLKFDYLHIKPLHSIYHSQEEINSGKVNAPADGHPTLEPFDEFEEMDLFASHYAVVEAKLTFRQKDRQVERANQTIVRYHDAPSDDARAYPACPDYRIKEESNSFIRRFSHSACVLQDTARQVQRYLITGGFGLPAASSSDPLVSGQHKRIDDCVIVTRERGGEQDFQTLSKAAEFSAEQIRFDRMHGQTCCIDAHEGLVFFSGGRQSPTSGVHGACTKDNPTFIAGVTNDLKLKLVHKFKPDLGNTWRHRVIKFGISDQILQLGGIGSFTTNGLTDSSDLVVWNLSGDKLGFRSHPFLESWQPRHSFGLDMRDEQTLLVFAGLKTRQTLIGAALGSDRVSDVYSSNVSDHEPVQQCIMYDFRQRRLAMNFQDETVGSYSMQVHFLDENQFVRVGGLSTQTGLPLQSIDLFDVRRPDNLLIERMSFQSDSNVLLSNAQSLNFRQEKQIVTLGGGGNCFIFGTHLNKSQLVFSYG